MNLLVSDYDQTLSMDDLTFKINLKKLKEFRQRGNIFMLSTGREYSSIKSEVIRNKIPYDYISCGDGTALYDGGGKLLIHYHLNKNDLDYSTYLKLKYNSKIEITDINSGIENFPDHRIIAIKDIDYKNIILEIEEYFKQYLQYSDYIIKYNLICLIPKGINKSTTIKFLEDELKLKKSSIFTIGDHNNDYEMIRDYNGFSMVWGTRKAKQYALKKYLALSQLMSDIEKNSDSFQKILRYR